MDTAQHKKPKTEKVCSRNPNKPSSKIVKRDFTKINRGWLSNFNIRDACIALTGRDRLTFSPSYDVFVNRLKSTTKTRRQQGIWNHLIINCGKQGAGTHWVLALWIRHEKTTDILILDPLGHTRYSNHIKEVIDKEIAHCDVQLKPTGVQKCGWRCGWICIYWFIKVAHLLQAELQPNWWSCLYDAIPNGWESFISRLLSEFVY